MSDPAELKAAARQRLRLELSQMPAGIRLEASGRICKNLASQPFWTKAWTVLAFVPTKTEPDIWPMVLKALAAGTRVCLPRYVPEGDAYVACQIRNPAEDLCAGPYGVAEPAGHCPQIDGKHLDLVIVPGVGFTPSGGRLGRGKGYYDRMLAVMTGFKCGVAFDQQVILEFPMEPHDVRLDFLVTQSRGLAASSQARL